MKVLTSLFTILILSACASNQRAIPDPEIPESIVLTQDSGQTQLPLLCPIPWTATECWEAIIMYEETAEANKAAAEKQAAALQHTEEAYNYLIEAMRLQDKYSNWRDELLAQERRDRALDRWFYRVVITLGGLVAIK